MSSAIYPGSFDPVTNGHLDIIERSSRIFEHLVVAVLENPSKSPLFTVGERVKMLRKVTNQFYNVEVNCFRGLLIDFCRQKGVRIVIKGLRAISDFESEFQMALVNRKLNPQIETMFMMTNTKYSYISSSIVKEVAGYGGDIRDLVPPEAYDEIINRIIG